MDYTQTHTQRYTTPNRFEFRPWEMAAVDYYGGGGSGDDVMKNSSELGS